MNSKKHKKRFNHKPSLGYKPTKKTPQLLLPALLVLTVIFHPQTIHCNVTHPNIKVAKSFVKFNNKENDKGSTSFGIATTSDGLLYKIPRTIANNAAYTVTGVTSYSAKNAMFLSSNHVFLLNEQSSAIHYYLLKVNSGSSTTLDKVSGNSAQLTYSTPHECNLNTYPIDGGNDRMILVFNGGLEILRYQSSSNSIHSYGTYGQLAAGTNRRLLNGLVIADGEAYHLIMGIFDSSQTTNKYRVESFIFAVRGTKHNSIAALPVFKEAETWDTSVIVRAHPMNYNTPPNPNFRWADRFKRCFIYLSGFKIGFRNLKADGTTETRGYKDMTSWFETVYDLVGIPTTNYFVATGLNKGTTWTRGTSYGSQYSSIAIARHENKVMANSDVINLLYGADYKTDYPIGNLIVANQDGSGITVGDYGPGANDPNNIIYLERIGDWICNAGFTKIRENNSWVCKTQSQVSPFCKTVRPFSESCLTCNDASGGTSYSIVDAYEYRYGPFKKACQPSTVSCSAPNYVKADSSGCYNCQTSFPNCKTCWNHVDGCRECNSNYALNHKDYTCYACTGIHAQCRTCTEDKFSNTFSCLTCNTGWILKSYNECVSSCDATQNPQCASCGSDGTCASCKLGYEFISNTDKFCRKSCSPQQYWTGKTTNTCAACTSVSNAGECDKCEDITGKCTACKAHYHFFSAVDFFCRKSCTSAEYWTGKTTNTCSSCTSVSNAGKCATCTDLTGVCTVCDTGYQFVSGGDKFCRKSCPSTAYWKGKSSNTCELCNAKSGNGECTACDDLTGTCTGCKTGYQHVSGSDKFCRRTCTISDYYWKGKTDNNCYKCSTVSGNGLCSACDDLTGTCTGCKSGYQFVSGTDKFCRRTCSATEYWLGKSSNGCRSCYAIAANGQCGSCDDLTEACTGCKSNYQFLSGTDKFCRKTCTATEYWKSKTDNSCYSCHPSTNHHCSACDNGTGDCNTCDAGYRVVSATDKFCRKTCPSGEYWTGKTKNTCDTCSPASNHHCRTCNDETGACNQCDTGYEHVSSTDKFCRKSCATSEFWKGKTDNSCGTCSPASNPQCDTCDHETGTCNDCKAGYEHISGSDKFCRKTCSANEYWTGKVSNECQPCTKSDFQCTKCQDITAECEECQIGWSFLSHRCQFTGCPSTHYHEHDHSTTCLLCNTKIANCEKCEHLEGTPCTQCKHGFMMLDAGATCPARVTGKVKKHHTYFDEVDGTIHMVYDRRVKAEHLDRISFQLTERTGAESVLLKVKKIEIRDNDKRIMAEVEMPDREMHGARIKVDSSDQNDIRAKASSATTTEYDSVFPVMIMNVDHYAPSDENLFKVLGLGLIIALIAATLLMGCVSAPMMALIALLIQLVGIFNLITIEVPLNIKIFLRYFRTHPFSVIPNPLKVDEDITQCDLKPALFKNEMTCLAFNGLGNILLMWLILVAIKGMTALMVKITKPKNGSDGHGVGQVVDPQVDEKGGAIFRAFNKLNNIMSVKFFFYVAVGYGPDALTRSFIALKYGEFEGFGNVMNYLLALLMVLLYLVLTVLSCWGASTVMKKYRRKKSQGQFIKQDVGSKRLGKSRIIVGDQEENYSSERIELNDPQSLKLKSGGESLAGVGENRELGAPPGQEGSGARVIDLSKLGQDHNEVEGEANSRSQKSLSETSPLLPEKRKKGGFSEFIYEDFSKQRPVGCFLLPLLLIIAFIVAIIVVYDDEGDVQTSSFMIVFIILLTFLALTRPFDREKKMITVAWIVVSGVLVLICCFILIIIESNTVTTNANRYYSSLGYLVVALFVIVILTVVVIALTVTIKECCGSSKVEAAGRRKTEKEDKEGRDGKLNSMGAKGAGANHDGVDNNKKPGIVNDQARVLGDRDQDPIVNVNSTTKPWEATPGSGPNQAPLPNQESTPAPVDVPGQNRNLSLEEQQRVNVQSTMMPWGGMASREEDPILRNKVSNTSQNQAQRNGSSLEGSKVNNNANDWNMSPAKVQEENRATYNSMESLHSKNDLSRQISKKEAPKNNLGMNGASSQEMSQAGKK